MRSWCDGVGRDKGSIRDHKFPSAWNSARSARHGECNELLNTADDLRCDPGSNVFAVRESNVVVGVIQLPGCLLSPVNPRPVITLMIAV